MHHWDYNRCKNPAWQEVLSIIVWAVKSKATNLLLHNVHECSADYIEDRTWHEVNDMIHRNVVLLIEAQSIAKRKK